MSVRRLTTRGLTALTALGAVLALAAAPAPAFMGHPYLSQITGIPSGPFSEQLCGVSVDPASGRIYASDPGNGVIDVFDADGEYQSQITGAETPSGSFTEYSSCSVAVSDTTGDIYVANPGSPVVLNVFSSAGVYLTTIDGSSTPQGSFGTFSYLSVTVDQASGDVLVADAGHAVVDRFNSANEYQSQITGFVYPLAVASAPGGDLYVADAGTVDELDSSGTRIAEITAPVEGAFTDLEDIAVDASGDLYAANPQRHAVYTFDPAHHYTGTIDASPTPSESLEGARGLATDASGNLYVAAQGQFPLIDIFGPSAQLPAVAVAGAPTALATSAELDGTVDPEGAQVTSCTFEYGTAITYGASAPCTTSPGAGNAPVAVSAEVTGLQPGTLYHYRVSAGYGAAHNVSSDAHFETPPALDVGQVANVTPMSATLGGAIDPGVLPTSYHFVYGTSTSYGTVYPIPDLYLPLGQGSIDLAQTVSGLRPDTTYHYALVVSSVAGVQMGADQQFTTPPVPLPATSTGGAAGVTTGTATLSGTIDPMGWNTTYHFEYGTGTGYGSSWPSVDVSLGGLSGGQGVVATVQNLQPGVLYHYRLVATNAAGSTYGADQTFTTQEYPPSVMQVAPLGGVLGVVPSKPASKKPAKKHAKSKSKSKKKPVKKSKKRAKAKH